MTVQDFYHRSSGTVTYVVYGPSSRDAVVIDPCLDFDPASFAISTDALKPVVEFIENKGLEVHWVLETHVHADHITGAQILLEKYPNAKYGIGEGVRDVQIAGRQIFGLKNDEFPDGWPFHKLFADGETVEAGRLEFEVIAAPGHTPACVVYRFGDRIFTGDAMFMPRSGTGRCDFPNGSAERLFESIQKLYRLPESTEVFVGHDYPAPEKPHSFKTTIGEQKSSNIHVKSETLVTEFARFRADRDKTLSIPKLFYPSLFMNIRGGVLPEKDALGRRYLPMPLTASF